MPQIGRIDVPDTLWEALVERAGESFTQIAFDIAKAKSNLDLTDPLYELGIEASTPMLRHIYDCVVALVRMQTGDFSSDDGVMRESDDYKQILRTAELQGDEIAYNTLPSKKQGAAIKNILDSNWPTEFVRLPPPS